MAELGWSLDRIAEITGARCAGGGERRVARVVIDSRTAVDGALFVALRGERFDGHDFVGDALAAGAVAALVQRPTAAGARELLVPDTLAALQRLGRARRDEFAGTVCAVTGSAGKTTTRRLLAAILSQRHRTHQPVRNFNNHIGVPLTLLELGPEHGAAVLELGCSDFGEIALLTELVRPQVGLVTNVGAAHLERLGDLDGVARAKGELFAGLGPDTCAVVNLDDPRVARMARGSERSVTFGLAPEADVRLIERRAVGTRGQRLTIEIDGGALAATLPLAGEHNARNAVAATAAAWAAGCEPGQIVAGLAAVEPMAGRLQLLDGPAGALLIDDTYNANPESARAALAALAELAPAGHRRAVLGDMLELGAAATAAHREVGALVAAGGVTTLVTLGEGGAEIGRGAIAAGIAAAGHAHAASPAEAAAIVGARLAPGDAVLVKGSRGMRMERVVAELLKGGGGT